MSTLFLLEVYNWVLFKI